MEFLQQVAIAIHPSIKVTLDFPSSHENGRLPVLDVEQWIGDVLVDGVYKKQILHSHYTVYPKAAKQIIPCTILAHSPLYFAQLQCSYCCSSRTSSYN